MASDMRLNDKPIAKDGAYIYAEAADGSQVKISKADLAAVVAEVIQPYTKPSYIGNSSSEGFNVELKNKVYLFVFNQDVFGPCLYSIYKGTDKYQSIKLCGEGNAVITINGSIANLKGSGDYGGHGFVVGL